MAEKQLERLEEVVKQLKKVYTAKGEEEKKAKKGTKEKGEEK